jgi:hypothetical protein
MAGRQPAGTAQARRVDWFAAGLGLVVAVAIDVAASLLLLGGLSRGTAVSQGILTFVALGLGGFLAGYIGTPRGISVAAWNGIVVAIGFIVVEQLAGVAGPVGPLGSAGLDTLGLVVDDVLVLTGGTLGGLAGGGTRVTLTRK